MITQTKTAIVMETSTPLVTKSTNLRRRTLMTLVNAPIEPVETVNDESERSIRRSIIEQQRKAPQVPQSPALNDSVQFNGEQDIKDHLQICTKLHAENKITARVAWQLKIIDVLKVVSRKEGPDTLQVASTSLDIGAKVYGIRVDDVHAAGLKLANSMARIAGKDQEQDNENGDDNEGEGDEEGKDGRPKRKKRKMGRVGGPKNTIAKDKKSLLAPLEKLESVFFSTRIDSNLTGVENLFTNRLPMDKSCSKFMVLSKEKAWPNGPDESVVGLEGSREFDISQLPMGGHICIPFLGLVLDKWDPEEEQNKSILPTQNEDVIVYDDQGFPVPELDGSICNDFNDANDSPDEDEGREEEFLVQQMHRDVPRFVDVVRSEQIGKSEYSYNSIVHLGNGRVIDQIWAGPSHWKLKFIRRDKVRYTGSTDLPNGIKTKKKQKHEPEPVNWNANDIDKFFEDLNKAKRIKFKKRINSPNKITLPLPDSSSMEIIQAINDLMTVPGTAVVPKSTVTTDDAIENIEENDNGQDLSEPEVSEGMDHIDQGDDFLSQEELITNQCQNYMGENLVEAPEYVPKAYVPYALQAKKMNMKKLKTIMWQILINGSLTVPEKVIPTTFSKLFSILPNALPVDMKNELSCSLAFSALLHLCNENNLKLTQLSGSKDFTIESDFN